MTDVENGKGKSAKLRDALKKIDRDSAAAQKAKAQQAGSLAKGGRAAEKAQRNQDRKDAKQARRLSRAEKGILDEIDPPRQGEPQKARTRKIRVL